MADRAFTLVVDAGEALLESGGEVFRAQNTMEIMAESLGVENFNVYVLTNGIFASAEGGAVHEVRHIPAVHIHLGRVEAINALSRRIASGEVDVDGARDLLQKAKAMPTYSPPLQVLAGAVGSAGFAFLFGGLGPEMCMAAVAGAGEMLLTRLLRLHRTSRIFTDILAAALGTAAALVGKALLFPALDANTAIIGALMVLTPGVALTMAIRDFINTDYLSGTIRLFDALLVAGCLACGVAFTYMVCHTFLGVLL